MATKPQADHFICCDGIQRLDSYGEHVRTVHDGRSPCVLQFALADVVFMATRRRVQIIMDLERDREGFELDVACKAAALEQAEADRGDLEHQVRILIAQRDAARADGYSAAIDMVASGS